MSLDDTYIAMLNFERVLEDFNEHLKSSLTELQAQHDIVSPHWQDEMRKQYDAVWGPFLETMERYVEKEGPPYVEFLNRKLRKLEDYLHGH